MIHDAAVALGIGINVVGAYDGIFNSHITVVACDVETSAVDMRPVRRNRTVRDIDSRLIASEVEGATLIAVGIVFIHRCI